MGFLSRRKRTRESQREVFEREALPHLDALHGMALRLTRDERQAEDLVQDALVKAYRFFHRFEEGSNIKAWLFKVLVNTFYNTVRKEKNIGKLHAGVELEPHRERYLGEATVAGRHAEEAVLDALAVEEIKREVEALPEEFRTAVLLCDVHDLSYKEIAEVVGCPVGTVMSRLYRGRKLLQKRLHGYAVEQGYLRAADAESQAEEPAAAIASLESFRRRKQS